MCVCGHATIWEVLHLNCPYYNSNGTNPSIWDSPQWLKPALPKNTRLQPYSNILVQATPKGRVDCLRLTRVFLYSHRPNRTTLLALLNVLVPPFVDPLLRLTVTDQSGTFDCTGQLWYYYYIIHCVALALRNCAAMPPNRAMIVMPPVI
ncbi:unnamed protein product [Tuber melanosporum]|uniref:(Perigord truffle) hypothetical protein n=1 Tax=Tuber melanosporum (strain Mel28) TaxID=656061 RepID=D5G9X6_TUBMM|nr:uncharacterized protein GSTUM_00003421001 [Tuber melanosporum]CAZ81319.1 unnamed protein product [Tuber melanosporum]